MILTVVLAAALASEPVIAPVVASSSELVKGATTGVSWRFHVDGATQVSASIYDARDRLTRRLLKDAPASPGDQKVVWDGRDDTGREVPEGYYLLVLQASGEGKSVRWDPSDSTGGTPTQASAVKYDPTKGLVTYALSKPSLVRIHLGMRGDGPLMRTLVDWVARGPGEHAEAWDGWDGSRVFQFGTSRDLDVQVWAYELPVNAVVVSSGRAGSGVVPAAMKSAPSDAPLRMQFPDLPADAPLRQPPETKAPHEMYNHWQHDRATCHNPRVAIEASHEAARGADGMILADRAVLLKLKVDADEGSFLQDERFESVIYIDGVFAFEEEQGYLPFTWTLKPESLTPGEHLVTCMVRGYEGHFGSASIRVRRGEEAGSKAGRP